MGTQTGNDLFLGWQGSMKSLDLKTLGLREVNKTLGGEGQHGARFEVANPAGQHAIACGLQAPIEVDIRGHVGFYCAGMNQEATVRVHGHAGVGLAENMMSGRVHVTGNASQSAGATAHGGLLVIEGDTSSRCGISMKGVDIVVGGSVGHMSGFMPQSGNLVICGDAGEALGDSIYEARIYLRGKAEGLGADCVEKDMADEHVTDLARLLEEAGINADAAQFRRYGSARKLYNFDVDNAGAY